MKKLPYNKKVFKKGKKSFIVSTLFFDTPQVRQYGVDERAGYLSINSSNDFVFNVKYLLINSNTILI